MDIYTQIYLFGIYTSLVAKISLLNYYLVNYSDKNIDSIQMFGVEISKKIEKLNTKISVVNQLGYFTDNLILYNEELYGILNHLYEPFLEKYME